MGLAGREGAGHPRPMLLQWGAGSAATRTRARPCRLLATVIRPSRKHPGWVGGLGDGLLLLRHGPPVHFLRTVSAESAR
jgi:hypothetical protein